MNLDENTKVIINGKKIELPLYNEEDLKVNYPNLDDYSDFIMNINGEKFNIKILKSDFERIKSILDGKDSNK